MSIPTRLLKAWPLFALAAIVFASALQATWWVFLVPIYEAPDEPTHLDYALTIHANKGLLFAQHTSFQQLPHDGHPYSQYLRERSSLNRVAFRPGSKVPADYGTPEFFEALDRDAPNVPILIEKPCQLAAVYPFGYYALLALWIEALRAIDGGITTTFFGARLFSVGLLCVSLCLTYGIARLLGYSARFSLLTTACVGLFPLTSFVASYVQPDNLGLTITSLSLYLALRARASDYGVAGLAMAGTALGMLLVTKTHFWLAVAPAVLGMVAADMIARPERRQWTRAATCLLTPSAILGGIWLWTVWGTTNYFAPPASSEDRVVSVVQLIRQAVYDFFGGSSHDSFWGVYGWLDTPIVIRNARTTAVVMLVVQIASWVVVGLTLLRMEQVASRLVGLARAGRAKTALRIAFSNPVMNAYFLFVLFMIFLFVWTSNRFGAQGRNWFPFMLPMFLVGLSYAPQALTLPRTRVLFTAVLAVGLLLYGTVGNYYARKSIRNRYYERSVWHRGTSADRGTRS